MINEPYFLRIMPRNRRYHEGRLYNPNILKNFKKRFQRKKKQYDFFSNIEIPENTQNTKFFKFNDNKGFYDLKGWQAPNDWNLEQKDLEDIIHDMSYLTQNYILGVENSKFQKCGKPILLTISQLM
jgi:hypothetical protein